MEEDLRIVIELLQAQRNDAYNIACNHMLDSTKLRKQVGELSARIDELIKELENGKERQRQLSEGQFSEGIESSGQRQSSKENKYSKSKV